MPELAPLFPVNRQHFDALSDATGIVQHAVGSVPDPTHGYCTDDVARALTLDLLHARSLGLAAVEESAWRSLRFLDGWWPRGGGRAQFDQQPIEATALLLAAEAAHAATSDHRYAHTMESAYGWSLGQNDLGVRLADPKPGACCDGLTRRGANENQGTESTLMWLIALERVRAALPASTCVAPVPGAGPRPQAGADGAVRRARD